MALMKKIQNLIYLPQLYPLLLVSGLLLIVVSNHQTLGHDRLHNAPQSGRQPAPIYSYSNDEQAADSQPLSSHRLGRPYSWTNQRLAKQFKLVSDAADDETANIISSSLDDEGTERRRQMGDLAPLNSHASLLADPIEARASKSNRWPTTTASKTSVRKPTSVETNRHGTKRRRVNGGATKSGAGTKGSPIEGTKRGPVGVNNHRHHHNRVLPPVAAGPVFIDQASRFAPKTSNESSSVEPKRGSNKKKNLVCYYGTWAVYRPDAGKFAVENIDPFLCTHVIYGFTGLSYDNMIKPLDPWNDLEDNYGKGAMRRFTNLKRINPDLKTLVAIGGWNEGSVKYSKMASEPEARAKFVDSVVKFLEKYNFDGLDLDWEYPGSRGGASYDKQNFVRLLRELSDAFKPRGYLLTAAVSAGKWFMDPAYDIPLVSKYLDLINLMAYDYHGGWETKTGMNAPLFGSKKHDLSREEAMLNVNWSVNYWLAQGAAREKLMLGVGSYGRSFTLDKSNLNGINAPASQKGRAGPYTREPGSLGYNEICKSLQESPQSWTIVRDPDYLAPYAYTNNDERQWVGYDDPASLALKTQFAKSMGLGGMMMWSIETDDFQGRCHNEKFPLLNTIRRVLDGQDAGQVQPQRPTSTTRRPLISTTGTTTLAPIKPTISYTTSTSTSRPGVKPTGEVEEEPGVSSTPSRPRPISSATTTTRRPSRPQTSSTTTTTTTTTSERPPVIGGNQQPMQQFECRADGMFADPRNCRKFYRCVGQGTTQFQKYHFDCAPGTAFNEQAQYCDFVYNVPTCNRQVAATVHQPQAELNEITSNDLQQQQFSSRQFLPGYFSHQFNVHHHQW